jgi:putative oxidoreductase
MLWRYLTCGWPLGCFLIACVFVWSGLSKLTGDAANVGSASLTLPGVLVYAAIVVEIACGIALALGFKRDPAALLLGVYLVVATLGVDAFWRDAGAGQEGQFVQFLKNTSILGGLLFIVVFQRGERGRRHASFVSRLLLVFIFFMNAFGVVSQDRSTHELVSTGVPEMLAPWFIRAGQMTQAVGASLVLFSQPLTVVVGVLLLAGFLVPATIVAHSFWLATPDGFPAQLLNFLKNLATIGALLVVASSYATQWARSNTSTRPAGQRVRA